MARIPELVLDSKLRTEFILDLNETVHKYEESDPTARRRLVSRTEHWKRQKKIGCGGYSSVWLETCIKGKRIADVRAVKEIENRRVGGIHYVQELEAIAKFSHSRYERCFVKSFGWYESPNSLFIVMEHLEHGDLLKYMRRRPPLSVAEAREIAHQILEGLVMMHENEFAHRDLKPNNILIKSHPPDEWWIKIADFGISKRVEEVSGISTTLKGTPGYIAPELYELIKKGSPYATDIWSFGEIVFYLLTKEHVFPKIPALIQYATTGIFPLQAGRLLEARVSQLGVDFVQALMSLLPEERPTAATAIVDPWIQESLPEEPSSTEPKNEHPSTKTRSHSNSDAMQVYDEETQITYESESSMEPFASLNTPVSSQTPETGIVSISHGSVNSVDPDTNLASKGYATPSRSRSLGRTETRSPTDNIDPMDVDVADSPRLGQKRWMRLERLTKAQAYNTAAGFNRAPLLRFKSPSNLESFRVYHAPPSPVTALCFCPDYGYVVAGFEDTTIRVCYLRARKCPLITRGCAGPISAIAFSPLKGHLLAFCSLNQSTVCLYPDYRPSRACHEHLDPCEGMETHFVSLSFSPDGSNLAAIDFEGNVTCWDMKEKSLLGMVKRGSPCQAIAFSSDSQTLICLLQAGLYIWDVRSQLTRGRHNFSLKPGPMALASTGETFVAVTKQNKTWFTTYFDKTGAPLLNIRTAEVRALALSPIRSPIRMDIFNTIDGHPAAYPPCKLLANIDKNGNIAVCNLDTGDIKKVEAPLVDHIEFSPNGELLASGSRDGRIELWDTSSLTLLGPSDLPSPLACLR